MNIHRILVSLLLALAASACAFHRENILQDAEYRVLGMSKKELLACAGVPSTTRSREGNQYQMVYTDESSSSQQDICTVTFTLKDGVVSKLDFSGHLKGIQPPARSCYQLIRGCW